MANQPPEQLVDVGLGQSARRRWLVLLGIPALQLFLVLMILGAVRPPEGPGVQIIESEAFSNIRLAGRAEPQGFLKVSADCVPSPPTRPCRVRYRIDLAPYLERALPERAADEDIWLVLPGHTGHLRAEWNGSVLYDDRLTRSMFAIHVAPPALVKLPARTLEAGGGVNALTMEISAGSILGGRLGEVWLGPASAMAPKFLLLNLVKRDLPVFADVLSVGLCLVFLAAWAAGVRNRLLLGLALICALISLSSGPLILTGPQFDAVNISFNLMSLTACAVLLWLTAEVTSAGRLWRWPVPLSAAILAVAVSLVWLQPDATFAVTCRRLLVLVSMICALLTMVRLFVSATKKRSDTTLLLLGGVLIPLLVLMLLGLTIFRQDRVALLSLIGLPATLGAFLFVGVFMWQIVHGVRLQNAHAKTLASAVADTESRLARAYAIERENETRRVLERERTRLMADLHDGLSGYLIAIQYLTRRGTVEALEPIRNSAAQALADLRLVIASIDDLSSDLNMALGTFREIVEPQVRAAGFSLVWQVSDTLKSPVLSSSRTLHIYRILQEALANALHHSKGQVVIIRVENSIMPSVDAADARVEAIRLSVIDDGIGFTDARPGGKGMMNMQRRAKALGATLRVERVSEPEVAGTCGTWVVLLLPVVSPAP